uniref:Uncharacterized protein n=1 Tax=Heliothis virescens TaxID=7102 RepID=A0A2A4JDY5_HELVI
MKCFTVFLVVVFLAAFTYAAPATNHGNIGASGGAVASGVVEGSSFGNGAFSSGGSSSSCGLLQKVISVVWNVC